MKAPYVVLMILGLGFAGTSGAQSLDELADIVARSAGEEGRINEQREAEFMAARDRQRDLLARARQEFRAEEGRSENLKAEYDRLERELAELETVLQERMGNLGELFGIVRQAAGDIRSTLDDSMVSAQFPGRGDLLDELARRKALPTIPELRQVWSRMVTEVAQSGKVVRFDATIERADGARDTVEVVRVGVFNAIAGNRFLDWDIGRNSASLVELARQPASRFRDMASGLHRAAPGEVVNMPVDFSRGQILRALVKSKSPFERVREDGGVVGYVIIGIGLLGLLLCLWKAWLLFTTGGRIRRQLGDKVADRSNPLGRVMAVYTDFPDADLETLELKLDEAILRETAPLETGLAFVRVLYVVAPLLGLLGTVVGMISTFQMITLFGTGDPRMMAGGISTALVTTVLGLCVAIPLTLFHSFLQGKSKSLIQVLEEQAAGIIARLAEDRA